MDFMLSPELQLLRDRTREFIANQVMPLEGEQSAHEHGPSEALRDELVSRARAAGLLTPHASIEMGGLGLSHRAKAVVFEEAGYSPLGPIALNIHASDEGNIHLGRDGNASTEGGHGARIRSLGDPCQCPAAWLRGGRTST